MYAIEENDRLVDGIHVPTFKREIISANILEVEAGTTGFKGGDSGHGGRTFFSIEDGANSDLRVKLVKNEGSPVYIETLELKRIEVMLGGDCELESIVTGLKFITKVLEDQMNQVHD